MIEEEKTGNRVRPRDSARVNAIIATTEIRDQPEVVNCVSFNWEGTFVAIGTNKGFRINRCANQKHSSVEPKLFHEIPGGVSIVKILGETNVVVYVGTRENASLRKNLVVVWDAEAQEVIAELAMAANVNEVSLRRDCLVVFLQRQTVVYALETLQKFCSFDSHENDVGVGAISQDLDSFTLAAPVQQEGKQCL